ncbi:unnamed protein product [Rotaria sp. Silwood2]|nr:unnamed protein product [Rotaria sp. Silwood2]CAF2932671.1 unnamed protein product [Rotaria sp. Silwood2]
MLCAVERINRECGSHFGFVVNSIFPELIQCLEQSFNILFFVELTNILDETLLSLTYECRKNYKNLVIE